jgi:hypothetical protein
MSQILRDAGHKKFKQEDILDLERQVLCALGFRIQTPNLYEESMMVLKEVIYNYKKSEFSTDD